MKKIIAFTLCFFALTSCKKETISKENQNDYALFGDSISVENSTSNENMMFQYDKLKAGDTIQVKFKSKIKNVCQKKGCWMTIDIGNGETMRVTFKDYGFFVPTDNAKMVGKEVIFQGTAKFETVSVEDQKHYAEDAGDSKEKIDAITEVKSTLSFEAVGVLVPKDAEEKKAI